MSRPRDLGVRTAVSALGIPVVVGGFWAGGWILGWVFALATAVTTWEFYGLTRLRGDRPFALTGSIAAGGMIILATLQPTFFGFAPLGFGLLLILTLGGLILAVATRWPGGSPLRTVAATLAGVMYIGVPMSFAILLRGIPDAVPGVPNEGFAAPMAFVLLPLLATWFGDTGAYFVGHAVGRTRLAPSISPGKTWEGAVGGAVGSAVAAGLVAKFWLADLPVLAVPVEVAVVVGLALSVAIQVGDLVESALKREAGVKDSGRILPGHGGFLDRVDGLLWAFPVAWAALSLYWFVV